MSLCRPRWIRTTSRHVQVSQTLARPGPPWPCAALARRELVLLHSTLTPAAEPPHKPHLAELESCFLWDSPEEKRGNCLHVCFWDNFEGFSAGKKFPVCGFFVSFERHCGFHLTWCSYYIHFTWPLFLKQAEGKAELKSSWKPRHLSRTDTVRRACKW